MSEADAKYVPNFLRKINDKKVPVGGYKLTTILVSILIIIPALGIGNSNELYNWLLDLNSIVMPMRYMWVFAAYFALKHYLNEKQGVEYRFTKSKSFGKFIAGCKLMLNILTPVVLLGLGLILPSIAKKEQAKNI